MGSGGEEIRKTETMDLFAHDRTKGRWKRRKEESRGLYECVTKEYEIASTSRSNYKKKNMMYILFGWWEGGVEREHNEGS